MSVEQFPSDRIKRIPVNLPFARVPTCEHDPGTGDTFACGKCPEVDAWTDFLCCEVMRQNGGVTLEREPLRTCVSAILSAGCKIVPPDFPNTPEST
jgi:hypothetical protein